MEPETATPELPPIKVDTRVYTRDDLREFEQLQAFSSVGKAVLSTQPSAPIFGFGSAPRAQPRGQPRAPGPIYNVEDKFHYPKGPSWAIGTATRPPLSVSSKYAHNEIRDEYSNVLKADLNRKKSQPVATFGRSARFAADSSTQASPAIEQTPPTGGTYGSKYPESQKFSFGFRRDTKGVSAVTILSSTPACVGPVTYQPEITLSSQHITAPKISFPKKQKTDPLRQDLTNQTFEVYNSVGDQLRSQKKNMPKIGIGSENRNKPAHIFKVDMVNKPTPLRLPHAHY